MRHAHYQCHKPLVILVLYFSTIFSAGAACISRTTDKLDYYRAEIPKFENLKDFNALAIPLNGVIFTARGSVKFLNSAASPPSISCVPTVTTYVTGLGAHINNIYPTSIPNIGMRITATGNNTLVPFLGTRASASGTWDESFGLKVELIKTGEITAGGTLSGSILQYRADSASGALLVDFQINTPVSINPQVPTCSVAAPRINVPLGAAAVAQFKAVGTTSSEQPFNISLNCKGGTKGSATKAYVTLTDVTNPANRTEILSLTKASTATGVGIQVTKDGAPLKFGEDSAAAGNANQWFAGTIPQGQDKLDIPLKARYVQTAATVGPGSANAAATFMMSYQ
jgi:type 1 fimbria pilin